MPFPTTTGSYNPGPAPATANFSFISKLKADGSGLVYSTYFGGLGPGGGGGGDQIFALAVDSTGAAYFGGISETEDNTPTTPVAFQHVRPALDPVPFVSKLSPDGSTLVYSTYLDGNPGSLMRDSVNGIAVDSSGSAYVTGSHHRRRLSHDDRRISDGVQSQHRPWNRVRHQNSPPMVLPSSIRRSWAAAQAKIMRRKLAALSEKAPLPWTPPEMRM